MPKPSRDLCWTIRIYPSPTRQGWGRGGKGSWPRLGSHMGIPNQENWQRATPGRHFLSGSNTCRKNIKPGTSPKRLNKALVQARTSFSLLSQAQKRHQNDLHKKRRFGSQCVKQTSLWLSLWHPDFGTVFRDLVRVPANTMEDWGWPPTGPEALPLLIRRPSVGVFRPP